MDEIQKVEIERKFSIKSIAPGIFYRNLIHILIPPSCKIQVVPLTSPSITPMVPRDRKPTFFSGKSGLIFFLQGDI
jgi:hypothetical protein